MIYVTTGVNEKAATLQLSGHFVSCSIGAVLYIENTMVKLTSRKRLPTGDIRMLYMADVQIYDALVTCDEVEAACT